MEFDKVIFSLVKQWWLKSLFIYLFFSFSFLSNQNFLLVLFLKCRYNDYNHLRASPAILGTALYLHMWRAKMKNYCSSNSSSNSLNYQNATVAFHKSYSTLFSWLFYHFLLALFKFFFFFLLDFFLSLPFFFLLFSVLSLCSP